MAVPETVYRLVERFDADLGAYKSGRFDEADVRNELINPLFRDVLGWDMSNEAGRSPAMSTGGFLASRKKRRSPPV